MKNYIATKIIKITIRILIWCISAMNDKKELERCEQLIDKLRKKIQM